MSSVGNIELECPCCDTVFFSESFLPGKGIYGYCKKCRIFFFKREGGVPTSISNDYFDDEYKDQYGKTYLEDFDHIRAMGESRINHIKSIQKRKAKSWQNRGSLLDIGCAYGPFLAVAKDEGFTPFGQDLFAPALEWVSQNLGGEVAEGDFLSSLFPPSDKEWPKQFDVISLWYVIEHFENPGEALAKINRLMPVGGILAFSTPSGEGISARRDFPLFLERSPADHYSIWKPSSTKWFLKRYGFRLKKKVITGHHPERIFSSLSQNNKRNKERKWLFLLGMMISRFLGLGDTYEVYAQKVKEHI